MTRPSWLCLLLCGCELVSPLPAVDAEVGAACSDGVDNDLDGRRDCADPDCIGALSACRDPEQLESDLTSPSCPVGWSLERGDDEAYRACEPWTDMGPPDCDAPGLPLPGSLGCVSLPLTFSCPRPPPVWPEEPIFATGVVYVDGSRSDPSAGDGTREDPFGSLARALSETSSAPGSTILVSGVTERLSGSLDDTRIVGTCDATLELAGVALTGTVELEGVTLARADGSPLLVRGEVTLRGAHVATSVEVAAEATLRLYDVVGTGIALDVEGTLAVERSHLTLDGSRLHTRAGGRVSVVDSVLRATGTGTGTVVLAEGDTLDLQRDVVQGGSLSIGCRGEGCATLADVRVVAADSADPVGLSIASEAWASLDRVVIEDFSAVGVDLAGVLEATDLFVRHVLGSREGEPSVTGEGLVVHAGGVLEASRLRVDDFVGTGLRLAGWSTVNLAAIRATEGSGRVGVDIEAGAGTFLDRVLVDQGVCGVRTAVGCSGLSSGDCPAVGGAVRGSSRGVCVVPPYDDLTHLTLLTSFVDVGQVFAIE